MIFNENTELKGIILGCREHDDSAFAELVRRYTPLVKRMISDFDGEYAEDELFSEACVALHRAAMSFDLEQGEVSFGLYARVCVYHHFVDLKRCRNKISVIGDYNIDTFVQKHFLHFRVRLDFRQLKRVVHLLFCR